MLEKRRWMASMALVLALGSVGVACDDGGGEEEIIEEQPVEEQPLEDEDE